MVVGRQVNEYVAMAVIEARMVNSASVAATCHVAMPGSKMETTWGNGVFALSSNVVITDAIQATKEIAPAVNATLETEQANKKSSPCLGIVCECREKNSLENKFTSANARPSAIPDMIKSLVSIT